MIRICMCVLEKKKKKNGVDHSGALLLWKIDASKM